MLGRLTFRYDGYRPSIPLLRAFMQRDIPIRYLPSVPGHGLNVTNFRGQHYLPVVQCGRVERGGLKTGPPSGAAGSS